MWSPLSLLLLLVPAIYAQDTCNIATDGLDFEVLVEGGFQQHDAAGILNIVPTAARQNNIIRLVDENVPGAISGFWFEELERLGEGFEAVFQFEISGGNSDGLAFVVQSDSTVDAIAGGGAALGFSNGVQNYLGVGFDVCNDRNADSCTVQRVVVETRNPNGDVIVTSQSDPLGIDLTDGIQTATVQYLADVEEVVVQIGGVEVFRTGITNLEEIFGGKFAFFGFTGSNSASISGGITPATVEVRDLKVTPMNSLFRMSDESLEVQNIDFGDQVLFSFFLVDTCNLLLEGEEAVALRDALIEQDAGRIQFTFTAQNGEVGPITEEGVVFLPGVLDSEIQFFVLTPAGIQDDFDLEVKVDGVLVQLNPLVGIVSTRPPDVGGLGAVGIGILSSLIVVLLIGLVLIVVGLRRYWKKLDEHAEDIEYGKTKRKIDVIDKDIEYNINPMVAPLDKLKARLAANQKLIDDLKKKQQGADDSDYTVEQLQRENEALRAEMNDLKKQQEYEGAGNRISTDYTKRLGGGKDKATFDQEQA